MDLNDSNSGKKPKNQKYFCGFSGCFACTRKEGKIYFIKI